MKKLFILVLCFTFWFSACSKKDDNTTSGNQQKTITPTQQNSQQQTTQQNTSAGTDSYARVMNVSDSKGGKQFVDFSWTENGKEVKLSDSKDKVIVLNFWATWCPPCRKELPDLSAISNELKNKNFKMVGVSVDENLAALEDFLAKNKLSYSIVNDQSNMVMKYMEITNQPDNVIPQTYIIDKNGKVVEAIVGSRSKDEFLKLINKYM